MGFYLDTEMIRQVALVAHQASLQSIPYDPILHDFKDEPAFYSGKEAVEETCRITVEESVVSPFTWTPSNQSGLFNGQAQIDGVPASGQDWIAAFE